MLPTLLITGASSGLGRAFFQHYVGFSDESARHSDPMFRVVGIDRQPWRDQDGTETDSHPHGRHSVYVQLDVTAPADEVEAFARRWIGEGAPVQLVVHCAGVRGLVPSVELRESDDVATAEALGVMDGATMMGTFEVNVVGTFNILTAVLPGLRLAAAGRGPAGIEPRVVVMASRMGSVGGNDRGGGYAYRASKAALNAVVKSLSVDVPGVFFALVHPGRVETGLVGGVREEGAISCEESLRTLVPMVEGFGTDEGAWGGRNLCYVDRFGVEIPW